MIKDRIDKMKYFETKVYAGWLYRYERDYCKTFAQIHWDLSVNCNQVISGIRTREKSASINLAKTIKERILYLCPCCDDDPDILPPCSFDFVDWEEIANAFIEEFADRSLLGYSEATIKYNDFKKALNDFNMYYKKAFSRKQNWFVRLFNIFCNRG